ncbi:MAG TPA: hypothetical protein VN634_15705 [Candidatus Limnocylindrales bacterium]|nr:hypothetical protein [Candidatus Limnocylindrales bacterium]
MMDLSLLFAGMRRLSKRPRFLKPAAARRLTAPLPLTATIFAMIAGRVQITRRKKCITSVIEA